MKISDITQTPEEAGDIYNPNYIKNKQLKHKDNKESIFSPSRIKLNACDNGEFLRKASEYDYNIFSRKVNRNTYGNNNVKKS